MRADEEVRTEWTSDAIDRTLDLLEANKDLEVGGPELDAIRAGRFLDKLKAKKRELAVALGWYEARRAALARSIDWLERQLEAYARIEYARTGLKEFPVGSGTAKIRKAVAVVRWDDSAARPWLLELAREFPAVIKDFSRRQALNHIKWETLDHTVVYPGEVLRACDPRTGEILDGLVKDMRPGQVTVSVKMPGEGEEAGDGNA